MHVVVVGAGISGLTTAKLLLDADHQVTLVSGDPLRLTTSHLAAAVWFPTAAGPAETVARWSSVTYGVLVAEAVAGVAGVSMRESLVLYRDEADIRPPLAPWTEAVGDVRLARADELPPGYPYGLRFTVPLVEMPTYLPQLLDAVRRRGARHVATPAQRPRRRPRPAPGGRRQRRRAGRGRAGGGRHDLPDPRADRPGQATPG